MTSTPPRRTRRRHIPDFTQSFIRVTPANKRVLTTAHQIRGCALSVRHGNVECLQPGGIPLFQAPANQVTAELPRSSGLLPNVYVRVGDDRWMIDFSHVAGAEMAHKGGLGKLKVFAGVGAAKSVPTAKRLRQEFLAALQSHGGQVLSAE